MKLLFNDSPEASEYVFMNDYADALEEYVSRLEHALSDACFDMVNDCCNYSRLFTAFGLADQYVRCVSYRDNEHFRDHPKREVYRRVHAYAIALVIYASLLEETLIDACTDIKNSKFRYELFYSFTDYRGIAELYIHN